MASQSTIREGSSKPMQIPTSKPPSPRNTISPPSGASDTSSDPGIESSITALQRGPTQVPSNHNNESDTRQKVGGPLIYHEDDHIKKDSEIAWPKGVQSNKKELFAVKSSTRRISLGSPAEQDVPAFRIGGRASSSTTGARSHSENSTPGILKRQAERTEQGFAFSAVDEIRPAPRPAYTRGSAFMQPFSQRNDEIRPATRTTYTRNPFMQPPSQGESSREIKGKGKEPAEATTFEATSPEASPTDTKPPHISTMQDSTTSNEGPNDKFYAFCDRLVLARALREKDQLVTMLANQVTVNQDLRAERDNAWQALVTRLDDYKAENSRLQALAVQYGLKMNKEKANTALWKKENDDLIRGMEDLCDLADNLCPGPGRLMGPWTDPLQQLRESLTSAVWSSYDHVQKMEAREKEMVEKVESLKRKVARRDEKLKSRSRRKGPDLTVDDSEEEAQAKKMGGMVER